MAFHRAYCLYYGLKSGLLCVDEREIIGRLLSLPMLFLLVKYLTGTFYL